MRGHLCVVTFLPHESPMCSFTFPDILMISLIVFIISRKFMLTPIQGITGASKSVQFTHTAHHFGFKLEYFDGRDLTFEQTNKTLFLSKESLTETPGQRPPVQRPPGQRPPDKDPLYRDPLYRDPWIETPRQRPPIQRPLGQRLPWTPLRTE